MVSKFKSNNFLGLNMATKRPHSESLRYHRHRRCLFTLVGCMGEGGRSRISMLARITLEALVNNMKGFEI
jgi:hypothetical protein